MSRLQTIRARLHSQRERIGHHLDALEAQLEATADESRKRVEAAAAAVAESAQRLETELKPKATELRSELEALRVQLALGKAESRDAFESQRKKLLRQLQQAEQTLDRVGDELEGKAAGELERFVGVGDRLRAELEAAELQFALGRAEARDALGEGRTELRKKIAATREELKDAGEIAGDRLQAFEAQMGEALKNIRAAFGKLAGR